MLTRIEQGGEFQGANWIRSTVFEGRTPVFSMFWPDRILVSRIDFSNPGDHPDAVSSRITCQGSDPHRNPARGGGGRIDPERTL
jgi:hypothetical protein